MCFSFVRFSLLILCFSFVFSEWGVMLRVCPPQVSVFCVQILGNLECLCIDILVIDVLEFSVVFSNVF